MRDRLRQWKLSPADFREVRVGRAEEARFGVGRQVGAVDHGCNAFMEDRAEFKFPLREDPISSIAFAPAVHFRMRGKSQ